MELRQVRYFLAVAEEGSITAAARKVNLTQPALSRQIKALEEHLGVKLLERGAHSVSLSAAGEVLARDGARWVLLADQMAERVKVAGIGEVMRVGYAPSLAGPLLGVALERFSQLHPRVRVQLYDCSSTEMRSGIKEGRFDLVLSVADEGEGIDWRPVMKRVWRLALPAGHPLTRAKSLSPADLNGGRLLLFQREEYPEYWKKITDFCRVHGVRVKVAGEFDGISSLAAAIEGGMGVAFVAMGSRAEEVARIAIRELTPAPEPICVAAGLPAGKEAAAAVQVFIEELRRVAAEG